mmetsp:Transcript_20966/g.58374  ORF Transcript_20966/g.58374 Transcript_20966/m.58374 type:complete len:370 (-) Transcript_20966:773-1882(-)
MQGRPCDGSALTCCRAHTRRRIAYYFDAGSEHVQASVSATTTQAARIHANLYMSSFGCISSRAQGRDCGGLSSWIHPLQLVDRKEGASHQPCIDAWGNSHLVVWLVVKRHLAALRSAHHLACGRDNVDGLLVEISVNRVEKLASQVEQLVADCSSSTSPGASPGLAAATDTGLLAALPARHQCAKGLARGPANLRHATSSLVERRGTDGSQRSLVQQLHVDAAGRPNLVDDDVGHWVPGHVRDAEGNVLPSAREEVANGEHQFGAFWHHQALAQGHHRLLLSLEVQAGRGACQQRRPRRQRGSAPAASALRGSRAALWAASSEGAAARWQAPARITRDRRPLKERAILPRAAAAPDGRVRVRRSRPETA